jgi:hypothetical protein
MLNKVRPDIENEMDELQRVVQDLSRDEDINLSVEQLVKSFNESNEETLTKDIWGKLENTESNEIEKDDWDSVMEIARKYRKTNPKKLKRVIESGDYKRPLILNLGDRYILVAGNTRLCTAAAMGVEPKVFIGRVGKSNEKTDLNEKCWDGYTQKGMKTMFGKKYPNCVKKDTNEASSQAQQAAIAINMKKKGIKPKNQTEEVSGNKNIDKSLDNNQQDMVYGIIDIIKKVEDKENRMKIAKSMITKFKNEKIDFDYKEFMKMCGLDSSKKVETTEMDASSSGEYSGQAFGKMLTKGEIYKLHNANLNEIVDASATGEYDVPLFGKNPRGGRNNPLKIDGPDSIYKNRAVKDKKFPKFGGPEGIFVKIKDKCKKFPYCNQGNTGALEFIREDVELQDAITEISKKYGLQHSEVENIVLNEISKIFI